ncbi:hypothetical protein OEA41_000455 [Lepraria neglecta]|uniref:Uncharacterized protein n=1 Tax=Lepraria neglecta TaxID=209136 RepID=A0AAD9ZIL2_9LECA|nr:hypothetical protein OEA41_000455 [Lepraria neglecta]
MAGEMKDGDLEIQMAYLARNELYSKKKPYSADFLLNDIIGAEQSNHKFDSTTVIVRNVRRRDPAFHKDIGKKVTYAQPAALPLSDYNVEGLFLRMTQFFPGQEKFYKDKEFDLLKSGIPMKTSVSS